MNILVIGNGFDLAHGLPTKYGDFLEWVVDQVHFYDYLSQEQAEIVQNIPCPKLIIPQSKMRERCSQRVNDQQEIWKCINDNFWMEYFLQCDMYQKENWIDFEREISRVIHSIDDDMKAAQSNENAVVCKCTEPFLQEKFINDFEKLEQIRLMQAYEEMEKIKKAEGVKWNVEKESEYLNKYGEKHPIENLKEEITYKQMITKLEDDLDSLIRALEIYIVEFVGCIGEIEKKETIIELNPNHVLSFNYSDTFERVYGKDKEIEYDYIHGKADSNNTIESNNMVLGIDEYLDENRKNKNIEFIGFKKYYQRIYKGAGCKYKDWMYEIKESGKSTEMKLRSEYPLQIPLIKFNNNEKHKLFIFGHSLDVTDKDILREFILNDNVYTTIFYMDKKDLKRKIANLVKVITQDELIRRTGGSTKTIEFEQIKG